MLPFWCPVLLWQIVRKVDVGSNEFAVAELQVSSLPHLMMYQNGHKLYETVGSNVEEIRSMISHVLQRDVPLIAAASAAATATDAGETAALPPSTPAFPPGKHVLNVAMYPGGIVAPCSDSCGSSAELVNELQVRTRCV